MFKLAQQVAVAGITPTAIEAIRMGRMIALRKANGGVGIFKDFRFYPTIQHKEENQDKQK